MPENKHGSQFLAAFWDLASDDFMRRGDALKKIIEHIKNLENTAKDATDRDYALKRLIRGLSSSRDSARKGFAVCLCALLRQCSDIETSVVIAMIEEGTKVK